MVSGWAVTTLFRSDPILVLRDGGCSLDGGPRELRTGGMHYVAECPCCVVLCCEQPAVWVLFCTSQAVSLALIFAAVVYSSPC